ncbi:MAG TPA: hypothetical protein VFE98_05765 [Candidatus Bathyarchaeia archaeon]|nr:hypothetical protein [Candidatus Bathyarchaeia archaeon]
MTLVEEMVETKKIEGSAQSGQFAKSGTYPATFSLPGSLEECRQIAKNLAYSIVSGFVEHDKGRLEKSVESFFQVYVKLFPEVGRARAWRAAELYVDACVKQDKIEDHPGHTNAQIVDDPRWSEVKSIFLEQCGVLGIPLAYAENSTNYFRYHGVGDSRYVNYCLEADRIFTTAVVGNDYWAKILGGLYVICTECHDKHDATGLRAGVHFASKYFEIMLREKKMGQQARIVTVSPDSF